MREAYLEFRRAELVGWGDWAAAGRGRCLVAPLPDGGLLVRSAGVLLRVPRAEIVRLEIDERLDGVLLGRVALA